ncbi:MULTISPECIES: YbdD/YjiX family protein [Streptomyces]|uniref:YbdD/YjiX family protein n=1 Tax=Streptomyces radiopugnans TaxID=403935 RepID=A0A1H9DJP1_9ACTN|nr:YbdD/YjiX family protein [Streptomyces radiopugnans]URN14079.1 YbdD/YjiX family protein [Streptomyces radiopugnans]SEQ13706.1 Protein of unknown function [Streptomyces radiopugnans]
MTGALLDRAARLLRGVRWYLREFSGEADYERFRLRHLREHPGEPVPSWRDYERQRARHREEHPQSRCC